MFEELKRRNVFRVTVAYVVGAWVIIEAASLILEIYESPTSILRVIVALLALGLPFAILFAWAFEVTPDGIKREADVDRSVSTKNFTARRLDILTIVLLVVAVGLLVADRTMLDKFTRSSVDTTSIEMKGDTASEPAPVGVAEKLLELSRLRDAGDYSAAFALASEIAPSLDPDLVNEEFWQEYSWAVDLNTEPQGATVYRQQIDAAEDDWEVLGTTPLRNVRFAEHEGYRLRFQLDGYRDVKVLQTAIRGVDWRNLEPMNPVRLDTADTLPENMVRIPPFTEDLVEYAEFLMDRFEVTNREYEKFVLAGGYENRKYWVYPFVKDGEEIPWDEATAELVDRTGRPGPATWSGGTYPSEKGDHPVGGVSWYEAAAYAEFAGKQLPTETHRKAAMRYFRHNSWLITPRSHFGGDGPRPVGEGRAMSTLGIFDLVGNVREWIWNPVDESSRGTKGAAWTDAIFIAGWVIPKSPWDRDATNGFRTIRSFETEEKLARLREPVEPRQSRDYRSEQPVGDAEFEIYKQLYAYDAFPLNAEIVGSEEFEHWVRQEVRYDLPYGERGGAYIYLPKRGEAPFEVVGFWGGSGVLSNKSIDDQYIKAFDFIVRDGRAVALPMFKGAYWRDDENFSITHGALLDNPGGTRYRDYQVRWVQDLSRMIDYLQTRDDLNADRLAYYGFSWGGQTAPIALAIEDRFDAAVLNVGGLWDVYHFRPEIDPINFITRVRTPVLMLNGEFDIVFPLDRAQEPMFDLLGTDPGHKKHYISADAHMVSRDIMIRETLDWLDRYLSSKGD